MPVQVERVHDTTDTGLFEHPLRENGVAVNRIHTVIAERREQSGSAQAIARPDEKVRVAARPQMRKGIVSIGQRSAFEQQRRNTGNVKSFDDSPQFGAANQLDALFTSKQTIECSGELLRNLASSLLIVHGATEQTVDAMVFGGFQDR